MADRQKPKSSTLKGANDTRRNKKAPKGDHPHTSKTRLSELDKVLMGGGALVRISKALPRDDKEPAKA